MKKKTTPRDSSNQREKTLAPDKAKTNQKACGKYAEKIDKGRETVRKVCALVTNAHIFPTFGDSLLEMVAEYESNFGKRKPKGMSH